MSMFGDSGTNPFPIAFTIGGLTLFYALARTLFPYKPPGNLTDDELAILAHRTRHYNWWAAVIGIVAGLAAGFGFWAACHTIAAAWDAAMPPHVFLYRMPGVAPQDHPWVITAFLVGLMSSGWGGDLAIRLMFGRDGVLAWKIVGNHKAGFDLHRLMVGMSVVVVAACLLGAALVLDCYTRVEEDRFVENEFLGFGETSHPYTDVKMIARTSHVYTPSGEELARSQLHVFFTDGTVWTAEPADRYQRLTAFLKRKTGKPLVTARHVVELPSK